MPGLLSVPREIIGEIAQQVDYEDAQNMRLVCRGLSPAVVHIALSRLTLDWGTSHPPMPFPLEQLQAYATPDSSNSPSPYVQHLVLRRVCVPYDSDQPMPFDHLLPPPEFDEHSLSQRRETFFLGIMRKLFNSLSNLKTVDPPLSSLTLRTEEHWPDVAQAIVPPCKKLIVIGFFDPHTVFRDEALEWMPTFVAAIPHLEEVFTDVMFDEKAIKRFFPFPDNGRMLSQKKLQHTSFTLGLSDFDVPDHVFEHIRSLRLLELMRDEYACTKEEYHRRSATFWGQIIEKRIYVEELNVHFEDVQDGLIDYLASYPQPSLKVLELLRYPLEEESEPTPVEKIRKFFTQALPVVAPGLRTLIIAGHPVDSPWFFDVIPEAYPALRKCSSLTRIIVMVDVTSKERKKETNMPGLLSMPKEILGEIAQQAEYEDTQQLRLACRSINSAVVHIALSRLTLDWDPSPEKFPVDQVRAYGSGDSCSLGPYVRHLTMNKVCIKYDATEAASFDEMLPPAAADKSCLKHRRQAFIQSLLYGLFAGLKNLKTVNWSWGACDLDQTERGHPGHYYNPTGCCATITAMGALLAMRPGRPLASLTLSSDIYWPGVREAIVPPCKRLVIEGFHDWIDSYEEQDLKWLPKFVWSIPHLQEIDTDIWFNERAISRFFPDPSSISNLQVPWKNLQHTKISIRVSDYEIPDHVFEHLGSLRGLELRRNEVCTKQVYLRRSAAIWRQLIKKRIYVEELWVHIEDLQDSLIDYLASYPQPSLKFLQFFRFILEEEFEVTPVEKIKKFFTRALPVIAPGLQNLSMVGVVADSAWYFESIPDAYPALQKCSSLVELSVMVNIASKAQKEATHKLIRSVVGKLPHLEEVDIVGMGRRRAITYSLGLREQS
ncbi:hypothetical protein CVT24_011197 [Panaeolus cyanescens]|uniref:F-box domain-containing protein n=1 Tax=Panaeolus cyanescens TaxID=181874 RepID=A0A409VI89_9AGAR|nr:hypothetical protein CVT24_011197 [Panaeolus cyanescens]